MNFMRTLRVMVAVINPNGNPDFFFCKVKCRQDEYEHDEHYLAAERLAEDEGYEPKLAFDEYDPAGSAIVDRFVWETATEVSV